MGLGLAPVFLSRPAIPWPRSQLDWTVAPIVTTAVVIALSAVITWWVMDYFTSPLRQFPGPWLAGWTNVWRMMSVVRGRHAEEMTDLHGKYGPVVRIGPDTLDLDYPELIKTIYGTDGKWNKTAFYEVSSVVVNGKKNYNIFSTRDSVTHAHLKRPVVKHYSVPAVVPVEPRFDSTVSELCRHLDERFVKPGKTFDLGEWIKLYSWDASGLVTFSRTYGYMEAGHDHDGTIEINDWSLVYFGIIGQMPFLDDYLDKNPVVRIGPPTFVLAARIAHENMTARLQGRDDAYDPSNPDYLQHYIDAMKTHPDQMTESAVVMWCLTNIAAGADTTAIVMRAVFYHVLRNPDIYRRLKAEIRGAAIEGLVASYNVARVLPYLDAVFREGLRLHPPVGMMLERQVPPSGLVLPDGRHVAPGMTVGMNAWVVGRNTSVYGADAAEFRPERWLQGGDESDDDFGLRMRQWAAAQLVFGGGSRVCTGRNLAMMSMCKAVATLINRYDLELVHPDKEWHVSLRFVTMQKGMECRASLREGLLDGHHPS